MKISMKLMNQSPLATWTAALAALCLLLPAVSAEAGAWKRGDRPMVEVTGSADQALTNLPQPATVGDPEGDTFGSGPVQIDISRVTAEFADGLLVVRISFHDPISAPDSGENNALDGFIDIDTDQNGNTGRVSNTDFELPDEPSTGLGNEYYIDFFQYSSSDGRVPLVDDASSDNVGEVVSRVPMSITPNQVVVRIPLDDIEDDGRVNLAVVVGTLDEVTDKAPNQGSLASTPGGASGGVCSLFETGDVSPCVPDAETICLTDNRFEITTRYRTDQGTSGNGIGEELTTDTGDFYFFDDANIEVVVKVLDACVVNDHFWIFAAGLTNVEVTMDVRDTETGALRRCVNPLNTPFQPIQLTSAFDCP